MCNGHIRQGGKKSVHDRYMLLIEPPPPCDRKYAQSMNRTAPWEQTSPMLYHLNYIIPLSLSLMVHLFKVIYNAINS